MKSEPCPNGPAAPAKNDRQREQVKPPDIFAPPNKENTDAFQKYVATMVQLGFPLPDHQPRRGRPPEGRFTELPVGSQGIGWLYEDPTLTDEEIADRIGCAAQSLRDHQGYATARAALNAGRQDQAHGYVKPKKEDAWWPPSDEDTEEDRQLRGIGHEYHQKSRTGKKARHDASQDDGESSHRHYLPGERRRTFGGSK
jgi:hypothetical protein